MRGFFLWLFFTVEELVIFFIWDPRDIWHVLVDENLLLGYISSYFQME